MEITKFTSKEEFINFLLDNNPEIKSIDVSIPHELWKDCKDCGIATTSLATFYFTNGEVSYLNIIEEAFMLNLKIGKQHRINFYDKFKDREAAWLIN